MHNTTSFFLKRVHKATLKQMVNLKGLSNQGPRATAAKRYHVALEPTLFESTAANLTIPKVSGPESTRSLPQLQRAQPGFTGRNRKLPLSISKFAADDFTLANLTIRVFTGENNA